MIDPSLSSISEITSTFPDEESCIIYLEKLRWDGFVTSPFDPISKVYVCKDGRYRCRNTGKYFNVKTGTIFYNSKIELQKWFIAIWLLSNSDQGITSTALGEKLGLTQKTAWYMLERIKTYLGLNTKPIRPERKPRNKPAEIQTESPITIEKDKMQMLEWLQLLKK